MRALDIVSRDYRNVADNIDGRIPIWLKVNVCEVPSGESHVHMPREYIGIIDTEMYTLSQTLSDETDSSLTNSFNGDGFGNVWNDVLRAACPPRHAIILYADYEHVPDDPVIASLWTHERSTGRVTFYFRRSELELAYDDEEVDETEVHEEDESTDEEK
eukprot:gene17777-24152_t